MLDDPAIIMGRVRDQVERLAAHVERIATMWQVQQRVGPTVSAEGQSLGDLLVLCLTQYGRPMRAAEMASWVLTHTTYHTMSVYFTITVTAKLTELCGRGLVVKASRGIWALAS